MDAGGENDGATAGRRGRRSPVMLHDTASDARREERSEDEEREEVRECAGAGAADLRRVAQVAGEEGARLSAAQVAREVADGSVSWRGKNRNRGERVKIWGFLFGFL